MRSTCEQCSPTATHSAFHTRIEAGIAELVIDRPPVNALNSQEWLDLARTLEALGQDPQVRVIVIRADGRGFCAGVDIKELDAHPERIVAVNAGNYATFKAVHRNPVPVIVAVHGYVLGAGLVLPAPPTSWWRPIAQRLPCLK